MSTDNIGWRGKGHEEHLVLTPEEDAKVRAAHERAASAQTSLDRKMTALRGMTSQHGSNLEGISNSLKGLDSFRRKVAKKVAEGRAADAVITDTRDLNRYTICFSSDSYSRGAKDAFEHLNQLGLEPLNPEDTHRNTWNDPTYKGINTTWRDLDTGQPVEIQFHTPESFRAKEDNHAFYELKRAGSLTKDEQSAADWLQAERYKDVTVPEGHESIVQPRPERALSQPSADAVDRVRAMEQALKIQHDPNLPNSSSGQAEPAPNAELMNEADPTSQEGPEGASAASVDDVGGEEPTGGAREDTEPGNAEQPATNSPEEEITRGSASAESDGERQPPLQSSEEKSTADGHDSAGEPQSDGDSPEQDDAETTKPDAEGAEAGEADRSSYEAHDEDEMDRISEAQDGGSEADDHGYGEGEREDAYSVPESRERGGI
ncbi:hypothetical protein NE235_12950 [Actinoallomurus spadix]|uniref:Uncharacterized protein n=1 Tax=Actinoallomurus spadix TaxID=79912 RepID=A0ABP3GYS2_9ACTN|nr:hypothetical protein [Actinoallomurus spadix]MCO5987008.1 hypothetical protein [Actinoallomurus spadix]